MEIRSFLFRADKMDSSSECREKMVRHCKKSVFMGWMKAENVGVL
jgi:hypothetical protein